jgi:hypothetical protein
VKNSIATKFNKSINKSRSGVSQVGLEILVKGRYQKSNMVKKSSSYGLTLPFSVMKVFVLHVLS